MIERIKCFVDQNEIKETDLEYSAGKVCLMCGDYMVGYNQMGAEETFSISQPVYDKDKNLLGYLGIGTYQNLDYFHHPHYIDVPCWYWRICSPTEYCKEGVEVYTYWQNFNEYKKARWPA